MIVSRQNSLVKHYRALADKKERRLFSTYLVEGEKSVRAARDMAVGIVSIIATPELASEYKGAGFRVEEAEKSIVDYCADCVTPQGIIAEVKMPEKKEFLTGNAVLLDGVSDPGNVGTIIRTCAAVGVENVIAVNSADPFSPKCVRATMSGIFSVNVFDVDFERAMELTRGKKMLVADMGGESVFGKSFDDFCLIIGNEAHGVSLRARAEADEVLSLPMKACMESLNAGVSCSVILYELMKNRI